MKNILIGLLMVLGFIGCTYQAGVALDREWEMQDQRTAAFLEQVDNAKK